MARPKKPSPWARPKIYERNPDTGVIRWRYLGETPNDYGWPNYGNILSEDENIDIKEEDNSDA